MKNPFDWFREPSQDKASRRLEIESLEPRILYSGTPVPDDVEVPDEAAQDPVAEHVSHEGAPVESPAGLSQAQVEALAREAAAIWRESGLNQEQTEALENASYAIADLPGTQLARLDESGVITIDADANGQGWFADATPGDFTSAEAGGRMDLLTVLLHEQGHVLGLQDLYSAADHGNLLYGGFSAGERRLPTPGQAEGADPSALTGPAHANYLISNLNDDPLDAVTDTLREAIRAANTDGEDSEIVLGAGTFTLSLSGINEDNAATGDLDIRNNGTLIIAGQGIGVTTIDAATLDRVFHIVDVGTTVTFRDLTITGGFSNASHGAGFYNNGGNITLENVEIDGNVVQSSGTGDRHAGGFYSVGGTVTGTNVLITDNRAERNGGTNNGVGGGFWISNGAVVDLTDVQITGNEAIEGGGFYISGGYGGGVTLTNAVIDGNGALVRGGGFRNSAVDTSVTIDGGTISNNVVQYEHGGGFYNNGYVSLTGVDITGNSVLDLDLDDAIATPRQEDSYGGGFFNSVSANGVYQAGVVEMTGGSIVNNTAYGYGGGFWNRGGTVTIEGTAGDRVEIAGNAAGAAGDANAAGARLGGGFYNTDAGTVNLTHVDFNDATGTNPNRVTVNGAGQVTGSGAGFYNTSQSLVNLNHVSITGHTASEGGAFYQDGIQSRVIGNDVLIQDNVARTRGGGFANRSTGATVDLTDSLIADNVVENEHGGAFYNNGNVNLTRTDLRGNQVLDLDNVNRNGAVGGGFYNPGGTISLQDVEITGNSAWGSGGGFYNDAGVLTGEDVLIDDNALFYVASTAPSGGGFFNTNQARATLTNAVISNNATGVDGGGLRQGAGGGFYNSSQGEVTIQGDSRIEGNAAADGGGFYSTSSGSAVTIAGMAGNLIEFQNNTARLRGGAFRSTGNTLVNLSHVSIFDNVAETERGGGFYADGASITGDFVTISSNRTIGNPPDSSHVTSNDEQGGGFWLSGNGRVALTNSSILDNSANADGGGFYISSGSVSLAATTVSGNYAENSGGGFLIETSGQITLTDSSISGNIARDHGGGFYARTDSEITGLRTHIDGNLAGYEQDGVTKNAAGVRDGGGFYLIERARLNLTDSTVDGNEATNAGGGARLLSESQTNLNRVTVAENVSGHGGGGLWADNNAILILTNATVSGNLAGFHRAANGGVAGFINSAREGGGIYMTSASVVTLNHSTVTGNQATADAGGGIRRAAGTLTVENSIVFGNQRSVDTTPTAEDVYGIFTLSGPNVVGVTAGGTVSGDTALRLTDDPALGALQANGGFGRTHAIENTSVASGAAVTSSIALDQRGEGRAAAGGDLGAFEADALATGLEIQTVTVPENGLAGETVSMRAEGTSTGGGAVTYDWQVTDELGNAVATGNTQDFSFSHATAADDPIDFLTVTVTVTDSLTGQREIQQRRIAVIDPASDPGAATPHAVVDTDLDEVDAGDGLTSLREAITLANASAAGAFIIQIAAGVNPTLTRTGSDDTNANGDLDISKTNGAVYIYGQGLGDTTISGGTNLDRVFHVRPGAVAVFHDLAITGGATSASDHGAGIRNDGGTLILNEVDLHGNDATRTSDNVGGGFYSTNSARNIGRVAVTGGFIRDNFADSHGAGFYVDNNNAGEGLVYLDGVTLSGNIASNAIDRTDRDGGAFFFTGTGNRLIARDVTIQDNRTEDDGGGFYIDGADHVITFDSATIQRNVAGDISTTTLDNDGGGFFVTGTRHDITLTGSLIGGDGDASTGTRVDGNFAQDNGGGFYLEGMYNTLNLGDIQITGNQSLGDGGGFANLGWNETVHISGDSFITNNFSLNSHGGGFRNDGTLTVTGASTNPIEVMGNFSRPTVTGNNDGVGGGFYNLAHAVATLTDVRIEDNSAYARGGGFYNASGATVTISSSDAAVFRSTISNNRTVADLDSSSTRGHGGGFYNTNAFSAINLVDVIVSANIAADDGGGFYQESNYSQTSLTRVEITNNLADDEGGGFSNASNGSIVLMDTVLIQDNEVTTSNGAGFRNAGIVQGSTVTVTGNRLVSTGDAVGAGFYNPSGRVTLTDLILENNLGGGRGGGFFNSGGGIVEIASDLIRSRIAGHSVVLGSLDGGGFYNVDAGSTVRLNGVDVLNNSAGDDGGGFYNVSDNSYVYLTDVLLAGNIAGLTTTGSGGGFNNLSGFSVIHMDNVRITQNVTRNENGGGFRNAGQIYGQRVVISENIAGENEQIANNDVNRIGGGFYHTGGSAYMDLTEVEIVDNDSHGRGGGFYSDGASQVKLTDFIIARNSTDQNTNESQGRGGGFWNSGAADVTLTRGEISENTSFGHGGGFYQQDTGSTATLTNVTISGNYAGVDLQGLTTIDTVGGGFYAISAGAVTLQHVTITNNRVNRNNADGGAGFRADTAGNKITLENSIVYGNYRQADTATPIADDVDNRTTTAVDFVLVGRNVIGVATGNALGGNLDGRIRVDPHLGSLQDNGGVILPSGTAARTHLPGSMIVVDQATGSSVTEDQRGVARPLGAAADLGAAEVDAPVIADDTATFDEDTPGTIDLTGNDTEGETGDLSINSVAGSEATVTVNLDGDTVTYDPAGQYDYLGAGETATDTFYYGAQDTTFGQNQPVTHFEVGGVVVGEAIHYSTSIQAVGGDTWQIKDELTDNPSTLAGSRTGNFLQALPDGGSGSETPPNGGPFVDYVVQIATAGTYQLFLRAAGFDGGSDSLFAGIVELQDGLGGANPDWYAVQINGGLNFDWRGGGLAESTGSGNTNPMLFTLAAGTYTLRVLPREDGAALDAFALVDTSLGMTFSGAAVGPDATPHVTGLPGQVQVTVTGVNDGPALTGGTADLVVDEGASASLTLTDIVSFQDADLSDTHTISIDWGDGAIESGLSATLDAAGLANLGNPAASTPNQFSLDAAHAYADQGIYTVTVTIDDQQGGVAVHTFTVTVNNVAPTAAPDTAVTTENTAVLIPLADLLANDTGSEPNAAQDNVRIAIVNPPANGTLSLDGANLRYTPHHGFEGVDTFTYTIDDGEGSLQTYTSNVAVYPGDAPPASLAAGQVESDTVAAVVVERQAFRLGAALTVDAANPAGVTYDSGNNPADAQLAAGTVVNSHLVHFDQAQASGPGMFTTTITFDNPILGLLWGDANLDGTDPLFGQASTVYPTGLAGRGLIDELDGDSITVSADGRTLTITLNVTDGGIDQLRVLTAPLAQETGTVSITVNGTPSPTQGGVTSSTDEDTGVTIPVTNPTWIQQGLLNPDTNIFDQDQMGQQIAIDGDIAVIGGDQTGILEEIFVYRRDAAGNWNLEQRIVNPDGFEAADEFGFDVAVDAAAGQIAVGARIDDRGATDRGSVFIYSYDATVGQWLLTQTLGDGLPGLDGGDSLGISISMTNDGAGARRMVVGASGEDTGGSNSGAAYVFEFNGTTSQWDFVQRLKASDAAADDTFGRTVAIDGDTIVVGAETEDTGGSNSGSAYIYQWDGSQWIETAVLRAPGAASTADDRFGFAVDVSGNTVVVGAHQEDEGGSNMGRVHIYVRNDNGAGVADDTWTLEQSIQASDRGSEDRFGIQVALHQDTLIVGSYLDAATGESDRGSAYIFTRSAGVWTQTQKIAPADENDRDDSENFGRAVAIASNGAGGYRYLIGADSSDETLPDGNIGFFAGSAHVFEDTGAPGTAVSRAIFEFPLLDVDSDSEIGRNVALSADGNTMVVGAPLQGQSGTTTDADRDGVVYVYRREVNNPNDVTDDTWILLQTLRASNAGNDDRFGQDVGISADGTTIVVGAFQEDTGGTDTGSAYVFELQAGSYVEVAKLNHTAPANDDEFGFNVAVNEDGSVVAVGARLQDGAGSASGTVLVYHRAASGWANATETFRLVSDDLAAGDEFGRGVALSGNRLVVGARLNDDNGTDSGSAYVFTFNGYVWQQTQKLLPADGVGGDQFGLAVDISGGVIVVGAHLHHTGTDDEGAAYVFRFDPAANGGAGAFVQEQKLSASNAGIDDNFGRSVAVFGNRIIVGASLEDSSGSNAGAAYVFEHDGAGWTQTQMLLNSQHAGPNAFREFADNGDAFGVSVDISANAALVGANDANRVIDVNNTPDDPDDDYIIRNQGTAVPFILAPSSGVTVTRVDATTSGGGLVTTDGTNISFLPNGDFDDLLPGQSQVVTFTYDLFDGVNTVTVTGTLTVHGVNDAPAANPDVVVVGEDDATATVIPVSSILGNDTDADAGDQKLLGGIDFSALTGGVATVDTIQIGEAGSLSVTHERQTVTLNRTFTNPVVIAQSASFNDGEPVIVRISNITGNSFEIQLVEPTLIDRTLDGTNNAVPNDPIAPGSSLLNGTHLAETVSFIVIEAGTYVLENGTRLEAGFVETANTTASGGFVTHSFDTEFTATPVILSQVQTLNSAMTNSANPGGGNPSLYLKTRQQGQNANGFQVALENQESYNAHPVPERIGYLAIQGGAGQWGSVTYHAGSSGSVDENFDTINFSAAAGFTAPPLVITSLASENTSNEDAAVRIQNVTAANFQVRTQEDTSSNEETDGGNETVAFLAISGGGFLNAIDPAGNITFHPNGDFEHLAEGEFSDQVINYIVRDANGAESTSTLTIRVTGANDDPVVTGESFTVNEDDIFDSSAQDDYEDAVTADNPLIYWRLGEDAATKSGGGTAQNAGSLGAAGNGTYQGAVGDVSDTLVPNTNGANLGTTTATGSTGDAISVPMTGGMPSSTLTMEMWVRSDASNVNRQMAIVSYAESDAANNEFLVLTTTGGIQVHINSVSVTTPVPTSAIVDGQWHHFAVTYNDATNQGVLYVDGVGTAFTHTGGAISASGLLMLGQEQDSVGGGFSNSQKFIGDVDEFALYGSVLSPPQLQAHIDNTGSANLLHNDTDVDASDTLTIVPGTYTSTRGATVTLQADGNFIYDPSASAELQALAAGESALDTFEYTVDDGNGGLVTGTVSLNVLGSNDAVSVGTLTANDTAENGLSTLTGSFTDADGSDGHTLTVTWDDPNDAAASTFAVPATASLTVGQTIASGTDSAILTITGVDTVTGQVSFSIQHRYVDDGAAPGNSTASDVSTITVTVEDALGLSAMSSTTVTVSNVAPEPVTDAADVAEDGTVDLDLLAGATDASPSDVIQLNTLDAVSSKGAIVTLHPDGRTVTYDTNGQFNHLGAGQSETDTFTYSITDDDGGITYRTVTITVHGDNDGPLLHNAPQTDLRYEELGTPVYVAPDLVVQDVDSPNLQGAVIQIAAGGRPGDSLEFAVEPPLGLHFARTVDPDTGLLTIVISGTATLDVYEDILRSLIFRNRNFNPVEGIRAIAIQVFDGAAFSNLSVTRIGVVNLPAWDDLGSNVPAPPVTGVPDFPGFSTQNGVLTFDLTGIRNALRNLAGPEPQTPEQLASELRELVETQLPHLHSFLSGVQFPARLILSDTAGQFFAAMELNLISAPGQDPFGNILILDTVSTDVALQMFAASAE